MKLVHISDLHLGYRQFAAINAAGVNKREADVMGTFRHAVDQIITIAPDIIVVGGDVFHVGRPSNGTIVDAYAEFKRLTEALPRTVIVAAGGNHDIPMIRTTTCILQILAPLGIHVIDRDATRLFFPALELSVLGVPDAPGLIRPALVPDPAARYNVLLLHGEVQGMLPIGYRGGDAPSVEISAGELRAPEWDYVALGHYHVYRQITPNCFYSGSIDLTSTNPWGEMVEAEDAGLPGKGFAERDLLTGQQTFHPLPVSRPHVDLPAFSAHELSPEDVDEAIRAAIEACPGGIDDKVVRLVVTDVARGLVRDLDQKALRGYKARALNLRLDFRRAEVMQFGSPIAGAVLQRKSLDEITADFFAQRFPPGSEFRDEIFALNTKYLGDAAARENPEPAPAALSEHAGEAA